MKTLRLTAADALVRFLIAQRSVIDGEEVPLFPGAFAIFGHGNVTSLGHSLEMHQDALPVWRGQSEEGMGLAAAAFAKASRRRQIMMCTSSIGPGATNMVTAAGVAMVNRLPVLFVSGDAFNSRLPDPVLQQVEHFGSPGTTVNDAFRPVVRYWDRITHPAQILSSLPAAVDMMLDVADCGPAFIGLPQDVAAQAYDYPEAFFEPRAHTLVRPRAARDQLAAAVDAIRAARRPVIIAGGGVHYSVAEPELDAFARRHGVPVVETVAGKSSLLADHPQYVGPLGVTGADAANAVVAEADLVVAVGTRLQDFTTGSWTLFAPDTRIVTLNTSRPDATKHFSLPVVGDARESLAELSAQLDGWSAAQDWRARGDEAREALLRLVADRTGDHGTSQLSYAQVVGAVHAEATAQDYVLTAAGGLPGELNVNWLSKGIGTFDCEYGFSCMGYEIAGAWGAAMARTQGEVFALVGDGSYLMLNSDIYASVLSGHKFVLVVCDNGGFAVIERLQRGKGGRSYNNMLRDSRGSGAAVRVDFAAHSAALGAHTERVHDLDALHRALADARTHDRTSVIVVDVAESDWTDGSLFWQVGIPEVSDLADVVEAGRSANEALGRQRRGY
ncbi:3D-(3,5/4)-trihydroxycyclohexane-1,2-dione acylhydrolase (decyclizing) [Angustibacter sp. Root456]|uniref:3D-(3,5/4)-trihydroxycyclohexane-1,2-dione acylhydrolase (decyclizing) n=1 Tax=Angustibacter sp. Root456 TaxID=1736539 RepID=UPI0006F3A936|nr:3D-(3,5/4)-trihydroxycyclohexane-1,2-dione acylhydrolase (decyclizing) [Angustibacter sp. Root456]KQX69813.1 3D-(3,5/4)-trihydroxycyclohexane-1,2-dione acylhydrolase (decyclizing) [Angustibacter sp. Root456]